MRKLISLLLLVVVLATILGGCGGGAAAASAAVCTGLTKIDTVLASVSTLSADTSVSDVKAYKARLDPLLVPLRKGAATLNNQSVNQLVAAYDSLDKTISALPADAKLGDASAAVNSGITSVTNAIAPVMTTLKCAQ